MDVFQQVMAGLGTGTLVFCVVFGLLWGLSWLRIRRADRNAGGGRK